MKSIFNSLSSISLDDKNPQSINYSSDILINGKEIEKMSPEAFIQLAQTKGNCLQSWSEVTDYGTDQKTVMENLLSKNLPTRKDPKEIVSLLEKMRINTRKLV